MSHCWGESKTMIQTTSKNIADSTRMISWNNLPFIYRDAMVITRSLGCQYIWIDSLCIVQDDQADWLDHSTTMADIYSHSYLNIAATACSGGTGTLFAQRKAVGDISANWEEIPPGPFRITTGESKVYVRPSHWSQHGYVEGSVSTHRRKRAPLLNRAWVLQERFLAPRTIHFGISEMIWECNTCMKCECGGMNPAGDIPISDSPGQSTEINTAAAWSTPKSNFAHLTHDATFRDEALTLWLEIVRQYSALDITKISDRPYALLGVATQMFKAVQSNYIFGVWTIDLPRSLGWFASPLPYTGRKRTGKEIPTWSWMSQYEPTTSSSAVFYYAETFSHDRRFQYLGESKGTQKPSSRPPTSMELYVTAAVIPGRLRWGPSYSFFDGDWPAQEYHIESEAFPKESQVRLDCPYDDGLREDMDLLFVLLGTTKLGGEDGTLQWQFLVLLPSDDEGTFKRIGIGHSFVKDGDPFHAAEVKSFSIL